jgi:molybdopterin converting factor small subunit
MTDQFTILYFAAANTFTKKKSESFPAPLQLSSLYDTLEKQYPGIKDKVLTSCALTVNLEYVDLDEKAPDTMINPGDEVAIIPPVSSG